MAKWTDYPTKTTPVDTDDIMIYDATGKANKRVLFSGLWNWIVDKMTNAVINNLQTNNKTILGALNELNSNNIGNTSSANHENIDRIENFKCVTWVDSDYNNIFGNQWCFAESKYIANGYAMQKLIAAQSKPVIAIRYCNAGKWGDWKCITAQ